MYNKVFLVGNLARDPELRYTPSGLAVARLVLAVNRFRRQEADAGKSNEADFINLVAWKRLAEICAEFLKKGSPIAVEGRLNINSWEKNGEKRSRVEVVLDSMQMLGRREGGAKTEGTAETKGGEPTSPPEEEIPF